MSQDLPNTYRHPLPNGLYYDMVRVRPGVFVMGSEESKGSVSEKPEHSVSITYDYYLGVYPITQKVWKAVMNNLNPSRFIGDNRPVEQVNWQDIQGRVWNEKDLDGFLPRLNSQYPEKENSIEGFTFRLPTEAEWEYAAKGGHYNSLKRMKGSIHSARNYEEYVEVNHLKEVGWYNYNSHGETKEVGLLKPNVLGLFDMNGNVFEWCSNWYSKDYYSICKHHGIVENPLGPAIGSARVIRGGAFLSSKFNCLAYSRDSWLPDSYSEAIGFRLVLSHDRNCFYT
ncbi:formylglycine-generating enzyme family protein [Phaeodactylibacter xiamenensis]|uniref:formylglycine-generating enzyme family protein n=1 Tax=Phaeodactylibacter xiamenensis TaxID=1524460 RepID=UPI003BA8C810